MTEINIVKFATQWPNYLYIITALVSGSMLAWPVLRRTMATGSAVSAHEATLMINRQDALVMDVRDSREFEKGHILNARNVPLSALEAGTADLPKQKSKPVIVSCENGDQSRRAAARLRKVGFERVFALAGGIAAWRQAGLPVGK